MEKQMKPLKLTAVQKAVLDRIASGDTLIRSEWNCPFRYFFEYGNNGNLTWKEERKLNRVTAKTAHALMDAGLIRKGKYRGSLSWEMELAAPPVSNPVPRPEHVNRISAVTESEER